MKWTLISLVLVAGLVSVRGTATAQRRRTPPKEPAAGAAPAGAPAGARVRQYDFSGDDIEGELIKPEGADITARQFAKHTSLIRIRHDFIKEIVKSAEDL